MCTVSFVPGLTDGGYVLVTNRDESPRRGPAEPPSIVERSGRRICAPRDSDAGGTWISVDDRGRTLCLLNGDGARRVPVDPGVPSRGLLVFELAASDDPASLWPGLQRRQRAGRLHQQPFRLLQATPGTAGAPAGLMNVAWDGNELQRQVVSGPYLETSSGLEPEAVRRFRRDRFERLLEEVAGDPGQLLPSRSSRLLDWHRSHDPDVPEGDHRSVCMHRPEAHTVSRTAVEVRGEEVEMRYQPGPPCQQGEETVLRMRRVTPGETHG